MLILTMCVLWCFASLLTLLFAGIQSLNIHQRRTTRCLRIQNQDGVLQPIDRVLPDQQRQGEQNLILIKGYSLDYITVPAHLLQTLENEQVDGRHQSLTTFAENATAIQRVKRFGIIATLIKIIDFISLSSF
ncbi:hypothetical protein BDF21DRAFT_452081 [Thamnidium elegans]|nr:hypothetical protein BDF21DRAFT_452081 [Thamnidium elegans]